MMEYCDGILLHCNITKTMEYNTKHLNQGGTGTVNSPGLSFDDATDAGRLWGVAMRLAGREPDPWCAACSAAAACAAPVAGVKRGTSLDCATLMSSRKLHMKSMICPAAATPSRVVWNNTVCNTYKRSCW